MMTTTVTVAKTTDGQDHDETVTYCGDESKAAVAADHVNDNNKNNNVVIRW